MNLMQILLTIKDDEKINRKGWVDSYYFKLYRGTLIGHDDVHNDTFTEMKKKDLVANDWKVVK